jgi:hypothetical protein
MTDRRPLPLRAMVFIRRIIIALLVIQHLGQLLFQIHNLFHICGGFVGYYSNSEIVHVLQGGHGIHGNSADRILYRTGITGFVDGKVALPNVSPYDLAAVKALYDATDGPNWRFVSSLQH